ncbi:MAG: hypothetical protein Q7R30_18535 [Acidobacteriota bacterium]|nr:hypothetical protein [Acidobacteriota bacterium]
MINLPLSVPVVAGWGVWLSAGLMLLVWARRAREANLRADAVRHVARPVAARPKSGVRPPKPAPAPVDAFGELQALLEPEPDLSAARRPGD